MPPREGNTYKVMWGNFASGKKKKRNFASEVNLEILRLRTRCCIGWVGENPGGMILVPPTPYALNFNPSYLTYCVLGT